MFKQLVFFGIWFFLFGCSSGSSSTDVEEVEESFDLSGTWHIIDEDNEYGFFVIRDNGKDIELLDSGGLIELTKSGTELIEEDGSNYYLSIISDDELELSFDTGPESGGKSKYVKLNSADYFDGGQLTLRSEGLLDLQQDIDVVGGIRQVTLHTVDDEIYYYQSLNIRAYTDNDFYEININIEEVAQADYAIGYIDPPSFPGVEIHISSTTLPFEFGSVIAREGVFSITHMEGDYIEGNAVIIVRDSSAYAENPELYELTIEFALDAPEWPRPRG